jgi:phenylacetyl-CoA:acceptor oxidoreductase
LINSKTAQQLGVNEGDMIEIESPVGKTHGRARLRNGVRPDVIVMVAQFGHWKTPFAKDLDVPGLNDLVPMHPDFMDGSGSTIDATKVSVRRIGGAA